MTSPAVEAAKARRADELCARAEDAIGSAFDLVAEVHRTEAWRHRTRLDGEVGYPSFVAWARERMDLTARQSYRYLAKARAVAELVDAGTPVEEAVASVPLSPKSTSAPVFDWGRPVKRIEALRADIAHFKPGEIPPSAREALQALLDDISRSLGATQ